LATFLANLTPHGECLNKWMIGFYRSLISVSRRFAVANLYRKDAIKAAIASLFGSCDCDLLVLQRVTPTPRIWLYLEAFYLMFAVAGLVWLVDLIIRSKVVSLHALKILTFGILLFIGIFANSMIARQQNPVELDRDRSPEAYAADYLADHLKPEDTLVATGPVDIETAYYLSLYGISFDRFYKRDHPVKIQNALVLTRENSKYETPESVVNFFKLEQDLDLSSAELVFEYANVQIYSVPAR
jgi:hypothetical protein